MSTKIIKNVLSKDILSNRTAADVRALVPGRWAADPDVPLFLYKSLKELLMPTATTQQFVNAIIEVYGIGATPADLGIHLITLPSESAAKDYGMQSDKIGQEIALLKILVQLGDNLTDAESNIVEQADLRVRWLLDYNIRAKRRKSDSTVTPGLDVDTDADPTIHPNAKDTPIICLYETFLDNEYAIAKASLYRLQYTRIFV